MPRPASEAVYRLSELAERVAGRVEGDSERQVSGFRSLEAAGPNDLSFLTDPGMRRLAEQSSAGALLVSEQVQGLAGDKLVCTDVGKALIALLGIFYPAPPQPVGVHSTAVVGSGCKIAESATIGPYAVLEEGCEVGEGAIIHAFVFVGAGSHVGRSVTLHPHVVLYRRCEVGDHVTLHSGTVVGADGFGYISTTEGHLKVPQVGGVVLEESIEVGANSAIDRGTLEDTRIGAGTKIDNLVQVGHNVTVGRSSILCGQVGIAGSASIGERVVLAGQAGISNRVRIGDDAAVAGKSAVFGDVEAGKKVAGIPAIDAARWTRQSALLGRLADLRRRVAALEREIHKEE